MTMFLAVIITLAGGACRSKKYIPPQRTLAMGSFSEIEDVGEWIIRSQKEWKEFWSRHATEHLKLRPLPNVDWDKEFVICVTVGLRRSGLYKVEIIDVDPDPVSGKLVVTYQEERPSLEEYRLEIEARPFHYVAVPKTELEVVFDQKSPKSQSWY
jgi:hypothetical protein